MINKIKLEFYGGKFHVSTNLDNTDVSFKRIEDAFRCIEVYARMRGVPSTYSSDNSAPVMALV